MTHKLKMLGMALVAVLALIAVAVSAASAEKSYIASSYPVTITASSALGNTVLHTEAGTLECQAHFEGTLTAPSSDLTITPTYTECKAFGFLNSTITGCEYTFTTPSTTGKADEFIAAVDIVGTCVLVASTCEVKFEPQGPLNSVTITDDTAASDMTFKANLAGTSYNVTKDGIGCPFAGTGVKTGGSFTTASPITLDAVSPSTASINVG